MFKFAPLLAPLLVLLGCSTTFVNRSDNFAIDRPAVLVGKNRQKLIIHEARIEGDVLVVKDYRSSERVRIPLADVKCLVLKDHGKGLAIGLGLGLLAGGGLAVSTQFEKNPSGEEQVYATALGFIVLVAGTIVGGSVGFKQILKFDSLKSSSQTVS